MNCRFAWRAPPGLNAYFISYLELIGGILLAIRLGSRLVALLFVGDMVLAYLAAHREAAMSIFSEPDKFYGAAPYTLLIASLIVLLAGPGRFLFDALLAPRWRERVDGAAARSTGA